MKTHKEQTVLIATLGESPVVVSAMVNLLFHQGITLDKVQIVYPDEPEERWVGIGYEFLEEYFTTQTNVATEPIKLPFADAHNYEYSMDFLRLLCNELESHEHAGNTVYLSLAGGRKHISALMAVLPQFYSCVKGLYHLHDTEERNPRKQFSTRQMELMSSEERLRRLGVPTQKHLEQQRFTLIELPFRSLTSGSQLRQWIQRANEEDIPPPVHVAPEAVSFFEDLFQPVRDTTQLELWLTKTAYDQYCEMVATSSSRLPVIETYLKDMTKVGWHFIPKRIHDQETDKNPTHLQEGSKTSLNHFTCKKAHTAERVFYYTQPNAIIGYPQQAVDRVIITRFPVHITGKKYDIELDRWVQNPDIEPLYQANNLPKRPIVLIASLGESPMVVTQTYRLLQERERAKVEAAYIIYPDGHPPAQNGADMLHSVCQKRSVRLHPYPVSIADVNTTETAKTFATGLMSVIQEARKSYPGASLALSLSGGRKGMSAIMLFAAQHEGILHVYHTTIRNPDIERDIEDRYESVVGKPPSLQAELLFLDNVSLEEFDLIRVPVITLNAP